MAAIPQQVTNKSMPFLATFLPIITGFQSNLLKNKKIKFCMLIAFKLTICLFDTSGDHLWSQKCLLNRVTKM